MRRACETMHFFAAAYSQRRATIGSTFVARRAGSQQARTTTRTNRAATPAKVTGAVGGTLYRNAGRPLSRSTAGPVFNRIAAPKWMKPKSVGKRISDHGMRDYLMLTTKGRLRATHTRFRTMKHSTQWLPEYRVRSSRKMPASRA